MNFNIQQNVSRVLPGIFSLPNSDPFCRSHLVGLCLLKSSQTNPCDDALGLWHHTDASERVAFAFALQLVKHTKLAAVINCSGTRGSHLLRYWSMVAWWSAGHRHRRYLNHVRHIRLHTTWRKAWSNQTRTSDLCITTEVISHCASGRLQDIESHGFWHRSERCSENSGKRWRRDWPRASSRAR